MQQNALLFCVYHRIIVKTFNGTPTIVSLIINYTSGDQRDRKIHVIEPFLQFALFRFVIALYSASV